MEKGIINENKPYPSLLSGEPGGYGSLYVIGRIGRERKRNLRRRFDLDLGRGRPADDFRHRRDGARRTVGAACAQGHH